MNKIHPTACVDKKAQIGSDVEIGPFCVVGPDVVLGDGCRLHNNVTIVGHTTVGRGNEFFPCTVIGAVPQDLKYRGQRTELIIGDHNVFREQVTVHPGTEVGCGVTTIGNHNRFLIGVHLAHDVVVGDHCVISNYVQVAGHVHIEDRVHMGGMSGLHHFVTIGRLAYLAAMSRVSVDVPPFLVVAGYPARVRGVNVEGMQRWSYSKEQIDAVREAYRFLFSRKAQGAPSSLLERVRQFESNGRLDENTRYLCEFVKRSSLSGVYGRYLESLRRDTAADRGQFYREASELQGQANAGAPQMLADDEVPM